jgi:acyl-[acyl carrier protein]--UDP-N-acetylglucosamine O-acyltransferase
LHRAVRLLTKAGLNTDQALAKIHEELEMDEHVERLIAFIRSSERGVVK